MFIVADDSENHMQTTNQTILLKLLEMNIKLLD